MNQPSLPGQSYRKFYLNPGQTGVTTSIRIFDSFKQDSGKSIKLFLTTFVLGDTNVHGSNVMASDDRFFTVMNVQSPLSENKQVNVNEVHISTTNNRQKLLQGFVDYNFDDNESEFWRNRNVKIVRERTIGADTVN